jgi:cation diffusion facilitator family transporter
VAEPRRESPIVVYGAAVANLGIAVAKFVAGAVTGSSSMLSEGIHSVVDTGNQVLLLVGINRSQRPPDSHHEFGHGKELYFWSLVVAVLLFGLGGGLAFYEGITHVLAPTPLENPVANYIVLGIAFVLEFISWSIAMREITSEGGQLSLWKRIVSSKDPTVVTVLLEDTAALLGLVAAFVGILVADLTGDPRFDGVGSIVIGGVLTVVALFLAYESRGLLVGERARRDVVAEMRRVIEADEAVAGVVRTRSMHLGPAEVLVNAEVRFKSQSVREVTAAIRRLKHSLREADERMTDVTIEPVAAEADLAARDLT